MKHSLISVVLANHNGKKYLQKSIESIRNQTFNDWELIIIDDGSTDGSLDLLYKYTCRKIKVIVFNDNRGIAKARHDGIKLAAGEYIAIQDSDDIAYLDRLEQQIGLLELNNHIFCVGGLADKIDEDDNVIGEMVYPPVSHIDIVNCFLHSKNPIIDPTAMFRRDYYFNLGGYSDKKDVYLIPDMDLWIRAIEHGYFLNNLPRKLTYYRDNPDGMTNKYKQDMIKQHTNRIKNIDKNKFPRKIN